MCAFSPEHNLTEWYTVNTSDANGWLRCHCITTFAQGLLYRDGVVRGLTCRASPNMFSGKQHSTKQPGNETCTNTTVTMGTHFHCQKGYYLKSVNACTIAEVSVGQDVALLAGTGHPHCTPPLWNYRINLEDIHPPKHCSQL